MNHNEICADNEHETLIAEVFDENDQWGGNARLIAAAPELLVALERVNQWSISNSEDAFPYWAVEAAIEKAGGLRCL